MVSRSLILFLPGGFRETVWSDSLSEAGYQVRIARSAYEALRLVQTLQPRFAVTTFDRAGMSLLRSTSMTNPDLAGVAITAPGTGLKSDYLESGAWPRNLSALLVNSGPEDAALALLKLEREPFGLEHYLSDKKDDLSIWRRKVCRSDERDQALEWIEKVGSEKAGLGRKTIRRLLEVGDELTTNGLYNAPVDSQGKPLYRTLPRPLQINLRQEEAVHLTLAVWSDKIALAASDPFGSLPPDVALRHLLPALGQGKTSPKQTGGGGAGLGLFRVFRALSRLVINIESRQKTELIGFLSRRRSSRIQPEQERSLQLYVKETSACQID